MTKPIATTAIMFLSFFLVSCHQYKMFTCPTGDETIIDMKQTESLTRQLQANLGNVEKKLLKIKSSNNNQFSEVDSFSNYLNTRFNNNQEILKLSFSSFLSSPCDVEARNIYFKTYAILADENRKLAQISKTLEFVSNIQSFELITKSIYGNVDKRPDINDFNGYQAEGTYNKSISFDKLLDSLITKYKFRSNNEMQVGTSYRITFYKNLEIRGNDRGYIAMMVTYPLEHTSNFRYTVSYIARKRYRNYSDLEPVDGDREIEIAASNLFDSFVSELK